MQTTNFSDKITFSTKELILTRAFLLLFAMIKLIGKEMQFLVPLLHVDKSI